MISFLGLVLHEWEMLLQILVTAQGVRIYSSSLDKHFVINRLKGNLVWGTRHHRTAVKFGLLDILVWR